MSTRDAGLIRGIGTLAFAATIVNAVVGAGIFTLPASVALLAGPLAPLSYLACAIIMAGIVTCFAEAGSRVPTSGGAYGTIQAAFGPATGFVAGMLLIISDLMASGGVAAAIADMAGTVSPLLATPPGRIALIAATYATLAWANLVGVRTTTRLITAATALKLLPLLLFVLLAAALGHAAPTGPPPPPPAPASFGRALIVSLFAFEGMETALMASGEVRNPARTIPRALFLAMLSVLALYLAVQFAAQHLLGNALAHAAAPLAEAADRIAHPLRTVMLAAAGVSMLAWLASDVLGTSRMLFAFSRDRLLPAWFARLTPNTQIPANAVILYVIAAATLAMTGSFLELVVLASLATVAIYILACAAALTLRRRDVAEAGPPAQVKLLPLAAIIGLAGMAGMILAAKWTEIAGLLAVIVASLVLHRLMHGRQA